MERYQIAIYIRLSKEDDKNQEESSSITTQRILLNRFVAENFSDYSLIEFCDDGYTGTNMGRPGMQAMLEKVREGKIQCIVVKDFSRFARDYIESGFFIERMFPYMGVRFISVNDHYDSLKYQGKPADMDVNFKTLLYDLYSKDLSKKVRSALIAKKKKGQYVSANSPFGYEKAAWDRHKLVIAEDEAEVVRRIFSLTAQGYTSVEIARLFNETKVKTPIEFKMEKRRINREPKGERFFWSSSSVCQILRNEIYTGSIVQNKTKKDFVGGKNCFIPREEWLITQNHHEAIVERHFFEMVQKKRKGNRNPKQRMDSLLTGRLICGCCKRNLCCRQGKNPYFYCHNRYSNTMEHCVHKARAVFLEKYVLVKIQGKLCAEGEQERMYEEELQKVKQEGKILKENRHRLQNRMQKCKEQHFEAYQNYVSGKSDCFLTVNEERKAMEQQLADLNAAIEQWDAVFGQMEKNGNSIERKPAVLSEKLLEHYVEKIVVYDEQHIEICWKKSGESAVI